MAIGLLSAIDHAQSIPMAMMYLLVSIIIAASIAYELCERDK